MYLRRIRPVRQPINSAVPITSHPPVHSLPGRSKALRQLSYRDAIQDLQLARSCSGGLIFLTPRLLIQPSS
jgi:hypothetical protein